MAEAWRTTTFGEIAGFVNGYPFKPGELGTTGLPVIRIKQLRDPNEPVDRTQIDVPPRVIIDDGDVIFSWSGALVTRIWDRGRAALNQHLFKVHPGPEVEAAWLALALVHATTALEQKAHGTTMKHVTKGVLTGHPVTVPPLAEQRRIVDLVAAIEREHDSVGQLEAAADRLLGSLRDTLVAGPLRRLGDLVDSIDGGTSPLTEGRPPVADERAVIKLSAIRAGRFNPAEAKAVTAVDLPSSAAIGRGDVIITRSNTPDRVGDVAYVDADHPLLYLSDLTLRIRPKGDVLDPEYLAHALLASAIRRAVRASASGTSSSMKKISRSKIREYRIPVPSLSDQRAAAETLRAATGLIVRAEKKRHALASVRSCVVQSLLDGHHPIPDTYDALQAATG